MEHNRDDINDNTSWESTTPPPTYESTRDSSTATGNNNIATIQTTQPQSISPPAYTPNLSSNEAHKYLLGFGKEEDYSD
ncbi:13173_t:CDS:2 [Ambispora gerdemannii]|uniref:13173_t:CDS:1 n=1 Tax=Ambispora gerdemannii TaxID=144530 RepID=A0A9N9HBW2_9GLOM|nr:13173_t:CDS:2 [Ambispora gerdemannii]